MGPYSLHLNITMTSSTVVVPSYRLRIEVSSAVGMSTKVFVYRKTTAGNNVYEGVASPGQLLTVPEEAPDHEAAEPNKFRLNWMEMADEQADVIVAARDDIERFTKKLTDSLTASDEFSGSEVVWIGILGQSHSTSSVLGV